MRSIRLAWVTVFALVVAIHSQGSERRFRRFGFFLLPPERTLARMETDEGPEPGDSEFSYLGETGGRDRLVSELGQFLKTYAGTQALGESIEVDENEGIVYLVILPEAVSFVEQQFPHFFPGRSFLAPEELGRPIIEPEGPALYEDLSFDLRKPREVGRVGRVEIDTMEGVIRAFIQTHQLGKYVRSVEISVHGSVNFEVRAGVEMRYRIAQLFLHDHEILAPRDPFKRRLPIRLLPPRLLPPDPVGEDGRHRIMGYVFHPITRGRSAFGPGLTLTVAAPPGIMLQAQTPAALADREEGIAPPEATYPSVRRVIRKMPPVEVTTFDDDGETLSSLDMIPAGKMKFHLENSLANGLEGGKNPTLSDVVVALPLGVWVRYPELSERSYFFFSIAELPSIPKGKYLTEYWLRPWQPQPVMLLRRSADQRMRSAREVRAAFRRFLQSQDVVYCPQALLASSKK